MSTHSRTMTLVRFASFAGRFVFPSYLSFARHSAHPAILRVFTLYSTSCRKFLWQQKRSRRVRDIDLQSAFRRTKKRVDFVKSRLIFRESKVIFLGIYVIANLHSYVLYNNRFVNRYILMLLISNLNILCTERKDAI